ncbi:MAG TPA: zinc ribbon domain-containing protein [Bryobacteraceae bacterium]|nr:zinc ribbon domain-containing protein [Bryobacteraceae bacterium]
MPDVCTCGARLPEDARFCHKCGKPQRDEPLLAELEAPPPPVMPPLPVAAAEPLPIGFHNKIAVRVAMLTGIMGFALSALTGTFALVFMAACGFFAVYWYCKRTGQQLSPLSGAHLGWITGLFGFLIAAILVTVAAAALSQPEVVTLMKEQWKTTSRPEADLTQIIETLSTPAKLAALLSFSFLSFTLLPAAGGAMGAYFLNRQRT